MRIPEAREALLTRAQLVDAGTNDRQLTNLVRTGEIKRVRHGCYVPGDRWRAAFAEGRHLWEVVAADAARRGGDVIFVNTSAAVAHGLPLFRTVPDYVHVAGPRTDAVARPKAGLSHHRIIIEEEDRVEIDGLPCSSLPWTVVDLARTLPREAAIAAADAAFRQVAWDEGERTYDLERAAEFRSSLLDRLARSGGRRGVRQARWVAAFADGRAELPGESVSRVYLTDLGFETPALQVPFTGPQGEDWRIDFGFDDVDAWGEFDGVVKYKDPDLLAGRSPEDVLLAEKQREDWIRGRSQRRLARWTMKHISNADALGARLASFGIRPAC